MESHLSKSAKGGAPGAKASLEPSSFSGRGPVSAECSLLCVKCHRCTDARENQPERGYIIRGQIAHQARREGILSAGFNNLFQFPLWEMRKMIEFDRIIDNFDRKAFAVPLKDASVGFFELFESHCLGNPLHNSKRNVTCERDDYPISLLRKLLVVLQRPLFRVSNERCTPGALRY